MSKQKKFILWGSSGHAKVLSSLLQSQGSHVVALFDNAKDATSVLRDVPLYIGEDGFLEWYQHEKNPSELYGLVAIGGDRGLDRVSIHHYLQRHHIRTESVVHAHASVCDTARLGAGTQVLAQSVVSSDVRVGEACIINHGAVLDHECEVGDGVHLAPHATLCGCVKVGNNVMIGAGAVVLPRIRIGSNVVVGAGAIVIEDLPSDIIVAGNPAKRTR